MTESPTGTPRFYYDCPIKAAFMARYHGMRFTNTDGHEYQCDAPTLMSVMEGRVYVHPDSLRRLWPVASDMVEYTETGYVEYVNIEYVYQAGWVNWNGTYRRNKPKNASPYGDWEYCFSFDSSGSWFPACDPTYRIIEREGQAFHWPKSEEA
jgi:hypothetical protein